MYVQNLSVWDTDGEGALDIGQKKKKKMGTGQSLLLLSIILNNGGGVVQGKTTWYLSG